MGNQEQYDQDVAVETQSDPQTRTCTVCGLTVPNTINSCPNDGTVLAKQVERGDRLLGKYECIETIGKGGMSVVYKAFHPDLQKSVAVKMMHSHLISEASARRFQQEARAASNLSHRNVIGIYDFGASSTGQPFMIMEFLDGTDLGRLLKRRGRLPLAEAIELFLQICDALQHAHKHDVLHRDLKPTNIVVCHDDDGKPFVKVVDFGIAKLIGDAAGNSGGPQLTATGEVLGTPQYMSPEQCKGIEVDARSDVYSLGCLMFEVLSGKPPFTADNQMQLLFKHLDSPAPTLHAVAPDADFPPRLERIIAKCLAKPRADRYQNMAELRNDLEALRNELGDPSARWRAAARDRITAIAGGALLIGVIAAGIYLAGHVFQKSQDTEVQKPLFEAAPSQSRELQDSLDLDAREDLRIKLAQPLKVHELNPNGSFSDRHVALLAPAKNLKSLDLGQSQITDKGLRQLAELHLPLEQLSLNKTSPGVTDDGMQWVRKFPKLAVLQVQDLGLAQEGLHEIGQIPTLQELELSNSGVQGDGLAELVGLKNLIKIDLTHGILYDADVRVLAKLTSLQDVDLEGITLKGPGLADLAPLKNLQVLHLTDSTMPAAALAKYFPVFPKLIELDLESTKVNDQDIAALKKQPMLADLSLAACSGVSDATIPHLVALKKLSELDLSQTSVSAKALAQLKNAPNLRRVRVFGCNNLSPADVGKLREDIPQISFLLNGN